MWKCHYSQWLSHCWCEAHIIQDWGKLQVVSWFWKVERVTVNIVITEYWIYELHLGLDLELYVLHGNDRILFSFIVLVRDYWKSVVTTSMWLLKAYSNQYTSWNWPFICARHGKDVSSTGRAIYCVLEIVVKIVEKAITGSSTQLKVQDVSLEMELLTTYAYSAGVRSRGTMVEAKDKRVLRD